MKLLFDQNISFKVAKKIQDIFPGAKHLSDLRIENYKDIEIWEYSKSNNYCIVTLDYDFIDISTLKGFPPKIIWLRIGNTSTENIINKILSESKLINEFLSSTDTAFLEIK
jgi:predicted nuclease of predicted toxin-antitoxin system